MDLSAALWNSVASASLTALLLYFIIILEQNVCVCMWVMCRYRQQVQLKTNLFLLRMIGTRVHTVAHTCLSPTAASGRIVSLAFPEPAQGLLRQSRTHLLPTENSPHDPSIQFPFSHLWSFPARLRTWSAEPLPQTMFPLLIWVWLQPCIYQGSAKFSAALGPGSNWSLPEANRLDCAGMSKSISQLNEAVRWRAIIAASAAACGRWPCGETELEMSALNLLLPWNTQLLFLTRYVRVCVSSYWRQIGHYHQHVYGCLFDQKAQGGVLS